MQAKIGSYLWTIFAHNRSSFRLFALTIFAVLAGCESTPKRDPGAANEQFNSSESHVHQTQIIPPVWYVQQVNREANIYLAVAEGNSKQQAFNNALVSIAANINTTVEDTTTLTDTSTDGVSNRSYKSTSKFAIAQQFVDAKTVNHQQVGHRHFVKVRYDNRPSYVQLSEKLRAKYPQQYQCATFSGVNAFLDSRYIKMLRRTNGYQLEQAPCVTLPLQLNHEGGQWSLTAGLVVQTVKLNELQDLLNWSNSNSTELSMSTITSERGEIKDQMQPGTHFLLQVSAEPEENGYLSIFNIYSNGAVCLIKQNLPLKQQNRYPEYEISGDVLVAGSLYPGLADRDTYVVVQTKDKITSAVSTQFETRCYTISKRYSVPALMDLLEQPFVVNHASSYLNILEQN